MPEEHMRPVQHDESETPLPKVMHLHAERQLDDCSKMACDDCAALIGKPARVEPHSALYGERARVRSDGILAHFKCRICGTLWERFEANKYFKREPQVWTLRPVTNQSVWASAKVKAARR